MYKNQGEVPKQVREQIVAEYKRGKGKVKVKDLAKKYKLTYANAGQSIHSFRQQLLKKDTMKSKVKWIDPKDKRLESSLTDLLTNAKTIKESTKEKIERLEKEVAALEASIGKILFYFIRKGEQERYEEICKLFGDK